MNRLMPPVDALPDQDCLDLNGQTVAYRIRASHRRRTVALQVDDGGTITAYVPATLTLSGVRQFVARRRSWLARARERLAAGRRPPIEFRSGSRVDFLGQSLEMEIHERGRAACRRVGDRLMIDGGVTTAARSLETWFRREAQEFFAARVAAWAVQVGRFPNRIAIRSQRRRWGSCSSRGVIHFNWRLMMASPAIVDYVVVHELCHLRVANHSPRFWAEVAHVLPDWPARRQALREFGYALNF